MQNSSFCFTPSRYPHSRRLRRIFWRPSRKQERLNDFRSTIQKVYNIIVRNPEGNRPLAELSRGEDNITANVQEVRFTGVECIQLFQDMDQWRALANAAMNLRVLYRVVNLFIDSASIGFSSSLLHRISYMEGSMMLDQGIWEGKQRRQKIKGMAPS
jgi:hypothetical protein